MIRLDQLFVTKLKSADRVRFAGQVISLAEGTEAHGNVNGPSSGEGEAPGFPAVIDKNEGWRRQMFTYVAFAIVSFAHHLSSHFDGRDVKLDGKLVLPWSKPVEEGVMEKLPKYTVCYGSGAKVGEWEEHEAFNVIAGALTLS